MSNIFEAVIDTNMKQLENSVGSHGIYADILESFSISHSTNQRDLRVPVWTLLKKERSLS
jgi:hypothetical protein